MIERSIKLKWNKIDYPTNRAVYNVIVSHLIKYNLLHRMASPSFEMKATSTKHLEGFRFLRESLFELASLEAVLEFSVEITEVRLRYCGMNVSGVVEES